MESEPMAGHSIDNLVPMAPQNLFAIQEGKDVDLTWDEAVDPDGKTPCRLLPVALAVHRAFGQE